MKFISYAVWWVRQAIFHALSGARRAFRLPQKLSGQVSKVGSARDRLAARAGAAAHHRGGGRRRPTLSTQEVEALLHGRRRRPLALARAVGEDGSLELGDTLEQDTMPSVELRADRARPSSERIQAMVGDLDEKEREVIRMRFGLDGEEPRTLQEIGEALRLSRERIRQIESKAKEKLRRSHEAQGLRGYLN